MDSDLESSAKEQVLAHSEAWIESFNRSDVDFCVAAYRPDATMNAKPLGTFAGRREIDGFWRPFMQSGAGNLKYSNVQLDVINANTVLLSADWSMNVGRGIVTLEKWVRESDGAWQLAQDDFEVLDQFDK